MNISEMSKEQLLAASKFFAKQAKNANKGMTPGDHKGTLKVEAEFDYSFYKEADYPKAQTTSLPYLSSMVIALHRAGFQRELIAETIISAATEALNAGNKVGDELSETFEYVSDEVEKLRERISSELPKKPSTGRILKFKATEK